MITRSKTSLPILGLAAGLIVAPLMAQPSERPQRGPQGERPAAGQRGPQGERPAAGQRGPQGERQADSQRGQMPTPAQRLQMMQQHLDLTPAQSTQIREILRREMTEMQALRQEARGEAKDRRTEVQAIRQKIQTEVRAVLTPEQQGKLDARRAEGPRGPRAPKTQ